MVAIRANLLIVILAAVSLSACGDNNKPSNIIVEDDMGRVDMPSDDTGGDVTVIDDVAPDLPDVGDDMAADMNLPPDMMVTPCGGNTCDPGEECINDVCVLTSSCGSALDLGVLPLNIPQTVTGSLITEGIEDLEATCANPESLRDRVISFEVEVDATVEYDVTWMGQFDGVVEMRSDCEDAGSALFCRDIESGGGTIVYPPGKYFLVLDQVLGNAGTFEATITVRAALCTPGVRTCDADAVRLCPSAQAPLTVPCADSCANGVCDGDLCTAAIAAGTYSGDGRAYANNLDFAANVNCTDMGDAGSPIATPGYEVIFYLPGLTAGQVVIMDAQTNDTNVNAIFIMQMCGDTATCAAAYKLTEQPDWVVTASGNYYVVIDKRTATNNSFTYSVDVL